MKKGFTLLEILLVIAAIGVLAAIVIVAINPTRQLAQVRNATRQSDVNNISKALDQYLIDQGEYPSGISGAYTEICAQDAPDCSGFIDLQTTLVPTYIAAIPSDPQSTGNGSGYRVALNPNNDAVSVDSINTELEQTVALNPFQASTTLFAWGDNQFGQFGNNSTTDSLVPLEITGVPNFSEVSSGSDYAIAVATDGTLWAWGANGSGQFGDGTTTPSLVPVQIGTDTDWGHAQANRFAPVSVAIKTDGTLWVWGDNTLILEGAPATISSTTPVQVGTDTDWETIYHDTLAIIQKNDGSLWDVVLDPTNPLSMSSNNNYEYIESSGGDVFGIRNDGTLWTLDDPDIQLDSDTDWEIIEFAENAAGSGQTLLLKTDGTLWTESGGFSFAQIGTDTDWSTIFSSNQTIFALKDNGELFAAGTNNVGQLGDNSITDRTSLVPIGSAENWLQISPGETMTLGILGQ